MSAISSVLTLQFRDKLGWIYVPLIILIMNFAINLTVSFFIPTEGNIYSIGVVLSIFIYFFIVGIIVVATSFPFAIGMSIRRVDYFFGTALTATISISAFTFLIVLMGQLENQLNGWGNELYFFHFPYLNDGTVLEQIGIFMILFLYLFFLGFMITSYVKRFGRRGVFIGSTAILLIGSVAVYLMHAYSLWTTIFDWIVGQTAIQIAYWHIPFLLIYVVASFLFLRRASV